jgi:hypothetical protein
VPSSYTVAVTVCRTGSTYDGSKSPLAVVMESMVGSGTSEAMK